MRSAYRTRLYVIVPVLWLTVHSNPAAQTGEQARSDAKYRALAVKLTTEAQVLPALRDANGDAAQGSVEPHLLLLSSTDGGVTGKARIGYLAPNKFLLDAVFSGPIAAKSARFADLTGLGNNVSLQLRVSRAFWFNPKTGTANAERADALKTESFDTLVTNAVARAVARAERFQNDVLPGESRIANQDRSDVRQAFANEWRSDLAKGKVRIVDSIVASGSYSVGNGAFKFVAEDNLTPQEEKHVSRIAEGAFGWLHAKSDDYVFKNVEPRAYVGVGLQKGTTFEAQDEQNICAPFGPSGLACQDIAVGAPSRSQRWIVRGDARLWLKSGTLAVTFRPSYDFQTDKATYEFPVYFLKNVKDVLDPSQGGDPGLAGGVTLGWKPSKTGRQFFALFSIGTILKLPGLPQ